MYQCRSFIFDQQFQQLEFLFRDIDRCLVHGECLRDIVQFQIVAYDFVQCIFSFENAVDLVWLSSCRTSFAVSALRIMRYCLNK